MKNLLAALVAAAALLTIFSIAFAVHILHRETSGYNLTVAAVIIIASLMALFVALAGYLRARRRPPV